MMLYNYLINQIEKGSKMAGNYVIKKSSDDKFYFNLVAGNNEKVLTSEMYNQKQGALNGI
jgi:uncharacterized protein YegP (UPF0339 family)